MSNDLEVELIPEEQEPADPSVHMAYYDSIELAEKRRYLCIDMARMCNALPKEVVPIAADMERFLLGKRPRAVE